MVVYLLFFTILSLFILAFMLSDQDITAPSVAFTALFSLASLNLIFNVERWKVNLQIGTYFMIVCGILSFLLGVYTVRLKKIARGIRFSSDAPSQRKFNLLPIRIHKSMLIIFLLLQCFSFVYCLRQVCNVARRNGYHGSIPEMIAGYKRLGTFTTVNVSLGMLGNLLYSFSTLAGYVWIYILINNYLSTKKISKIIVLNALLSVAILLSKGGRTGAVQIIVAAIIILMLLRSKEYGSRKLSMKQFMLLIVAAVLGLSVFQLVGGLVGRESDYDFSHYLAIYISAPIRNFDYFLRKPHNSPDVFGKMTFAKLINFLGVRLHKPNWVYELDLPFLTANGARAGNVYTVFYAFYYDFGKLGVICLSWLMGILSQVFHDLASDSRRTGKIRLSVIFYSYIWFSIAFSFFSNKFFEELVNDEIVKKLIFWYVTIWIAEHVKITGGLKLTSFRIRIRS